MTESSLFFVIVNRGKANRLLHKAREIGARGGTILLGEGTMQSKLFDLLGINETHKEILLMAVSHELSDKVYAMLRGEFQLHKRFRGIAFSVPYRLWRPDKGPSREQHDYSKRHPYRCIIAVVDKGQGSECMSIAKAAGAGGGTIIHARGAGVPQEFYFPLVVEPQKDMVLIVTPEGSAPVIRNAIYTGMKLHEPGRGIVFAMPVLSTIGLYEERRQEVST